MQMLHRSDPPPPPFGANTHSKQMQIFLTVKQAASRLDAKNLCHCSTMYLERRLWTSFP
ncbi:uncharacterized protein BO66DRAFT_476045 [Aspergillus aculeatinus CBS 121060]|uniref:Uncharacterized protein n=1 Tax=Aspergillus aculeatinus CBS 121060 TaxID=1448322 RepID=A0ACD1GRT6_9EURO|nr:hypothetical protein BO66DRAFT_476045 [Aspergillus aculeatinus CBS 121060]RAH64151.1 hypothetical protein BO66DRAFT_476045 [Aspergillus aculeatinus CBS 121060]